MSKAIIYLVILVVVAGRLYLLLGGSEYGQNTPNSQTEQVSQQNSNPPNNPPSGENQSNSQLQGNQQGGKQEIREVVVEGDEFKFIPDSVNLKAGEKVRIVFKNIGRAPHNLIIEGLNIGSRTIGGGQTDSFEFTAPSSGTYTFFCSVPGHREAGMEGELKVE
jgi:plastocyanin